MLNRNSLKASLLVAAPVLFVTSALQAQERTLTSVTALQTTNVNAKAFIETFVKVVNETGKGILQIKYLGGQEVVPPSKAAAAVKRGQFDLLSSPTAYYIGTVPEGYGLTASNQGPRVLRENGAWKMLEDIWAAKAGVKLISWGNNMTSYHMYMAKPLKYTAEGLPDLEGVKMRATGTYRPLFRALGATTINIKGSEVVTAMQRGTVDGFGWTDQIVGVSMHTVTKYRIFPNFYQSNTVETMNMDSYNSLTQKQRDFLHKTAVAFETASVLFTEAERKKEDKILKEAGVEDVYLKPDAAAKYLAIAHGEVWKELDTRSKHSAALKKLLYIEGKPNRQVDLGRALDEKR